MRKAAFDRAPAGGEIRVAIGQGPDCVQVIRQNNGSLDREGVTCAHLAKRSPQQVNVVGQQHASAIGEIDREEITASRQEIPLIVCHPVPEPADPMGFAALNPFYRYLTLRDAGCRRGARLFGAGSGSSSSLTGG